MTYRVEATDLYDFTGLGPTWIEFGFLACNLCDARIPPGDGLLEVGEIQYQAITAGWIRLGIMDECPDCHRASYQLKDGEG